MTTSELETERHHLALDCAAWAVGQYGTEAGAEPFTIYAECYPFFLRHIEDADDLALWQRKDYRDILALVRRRL